MRTNYKKLSGKALRERWRQVSGIQLNENQSHHLMKEKDEVIDTFTLTYGELDKIIDDRVKAYFNDTFLDPEDLDTEEEIDEDLQRILDELEFDIEYGE